MLKTISHKQKLLTIIILSAIYFCFAWISWKVIGLQMCEIDNRLCRDLFIHSLSGPFLDGLFLKSIIASSFILVFFSEHIYRVWKWFALIAIPLGFITIIFPVHESGGGWIGKTEYSDLLGYIFFFITILIALFTTFYDWFKKK